MGQAGQTVPEMTPEFVQSVSERYIELYEKITGMKFVKADESKLTDRIAENTLNCLQNLHK